MSHGLSQAELIAINLLIYGTMSLVLKYSVLLLLPRILGRRDADVWQVTSLRDLHSISRASEDETSEQISLKSAVPTSAKSAHM